MDINEQHQEIRNWLEKVYGGKAIPQYEVDDRTIDILYSLKLKCERRDRDKQLHLDDLTQKTEEYNLEAHRLARLLQGIGLSVGSLSQSGTTYLKTLESIALLTEIKDTSDTSYLLGLTELSQAQAHVKEERAREQKHAVRISEKTKAALVKTNVLKRMLERLEEQRSSEKDVLDKKAKQAGHLQAKTKEYRSRVEDLQAKLSKTGIQPDLYHKVLLQKSKELQSLKDKMTTLRLKLDSYHKLPPDISLAKVKIEEARAELSKLETELSKTIDLMHM